MAPAVRRAAAAAPGGVPFGELGMYVAGGGMPEGDYVALNHQVLMHTLMKANGQPAGPARLSVMITFKSFRDGELRDQPFSLGGKAHESFAPNPQTGKGLVPVPGGPGFTLNNSTNWSVYLKSLYDSGLPQGVFINDLSVLDGTWVHIANVPEPEERKTFMQGAKTGEVGQQEARKSSGLIPVVSAILEGGAPWEGGGGDIEIEAATKPAPKPAVARPAAAAPKAAAPAARPAVRPPAPVAPVVEEPAEEAAGEAVDPAIETAAINGISSVLETAPNGVTKLALRTGTFKAVSAAEGAEAAQAVLNTYFGSDAALNAVLANHGFNVVGSQIKPL